MQQKNCVSRTFAHKSAKFAYSLANHYPKWVKIDPLRESFNVILYVDARFLTRRLSQAFDILAALQSKICATTLHHNGEFARRRRMHSAAWIPNSISFSQLTHWHKSCVS